MSIFGKGSRLDLDHQQLFSIVYHVARGGNKGNGEGHLSIETLPLRSQTPLLNKFLILRRIGRVVVDYHFQRSIVKVEIPIQIYEDQI